MSGKGSAICRDPIGPSAAAIGASNRPHILRITWRISDRIGCEKAAPTILAIPCAAAAEQADISEVAGKKVLVTSRTEIIRKMPSFEFENFRGATDIAMSSYFDITTC